MRRPTVVVLLAGSLLVAACDEAVVTAPPQGQATSAVYQVGPPVGPRPSKDVTLRAVDVLSTRLTTIGVGSFTVAGGDSIVFDFLAPVTDAQVRAVLLAPGKVSFDAIGPPGGSQPVEGQPLPADKTALFDGDQIASARLDTDASGGPMVDIQLKDDGTRAFALYTSTHVGDHFAIVLDGRIVVMPIVMSAITDGSVAISLPARQPTISIQVLAAILASGPLPAAWSQAAVTRR